MKREFRLKKSLDFKRVLDNGQKIINKIFKVYYISNQSNAHVGISVPSSIGNAVTRNKIKRQVRNILSNNFDFNQSLDIVIIIKSHYLNETFLHNELELKAILTEMLKRFEERKNI